MIITNAITQMVKEFHTAYELPTSSWDGKPNLYNARRELRQRLLREEFTEYELGEATNDLAEIADALGDLAYIIWGTALEYGIPLDEVIGEIHRSNMSKLGADGKPLIREDGKVLKGPNYTPPDIAGILQRNGWSSG